MSGSVRRRGFQGARGSRWGRHSATSVSVVVSVVVVVFFVLALLPGTLGVVRRPMEGLKWSLFRLRGSSDARCLDGSPAGYYVRLPAAPKPPFDTVLVHIHGGAWCTSVEECAARAREGLGSSADWDPSSLQSPNGPPLIAQHVLRPGAIPGRVLLVYARYCDGSSFTSDRAAPVETTSGQRLWFRGRATFEALFDDLELRFGLGRTSGSPQKLHIQGSSASGMAVLAHLDRIQARYEGHGVLVTGLVDGAFFATPPDVLPTGRSWEAGLAFAMQHLWNGTFAVDDDCRRATTHAPSLHACLLVGWAARFVRTPIFFVQSVYDSANLALLMALGCFPGVPAGGCSDAQLVRAEQLRTTLLRAGLHALAPHPDGVPLGEVASAHALFLSSCVGHNRCCDAHWTTPDVRPLRATASASSSHVSLLEAFDAWWRSAALDSRPLRRSHRRSPTMPHLVPSPPTVSQWETDHAQARRVDEAWRHLAAHAGPSDHIHVDLRRWFESDVSVVTGESTGREGAAFVPDSRIRQTGWRADCPVGCAGWC